jgi:hypothetical protein
MTTVKLHPFARFVNRAMLQRGHDDVWQLFSLPHFLEATSSNARRQRRTLRGNSRQSRAASVIQVYELICFPDVGDNVEFTDGFQLRCPKG